MLLIHKADLYVPRILKSRWTLVAICALALVLRMAVAVLFPGFEHPDEVFQMLEQAHRLAFGNGFIPWEFDEGVRSYFFVGILAGIFRVAERIAPGSYLLAARLVRSPASSRHAQPDREDMATSAELRRTAHPEDFRRASRRSDKRWRRSPWPCRTCRAIPPFAQTFLVAPLVVPRFPPALHAGFSRRFRKAPRRKSRES